jgi:hypothetical protein
MSSQSETFTFHVKHHDRQINPGGGVPKTVRVNSHDRTKKKKK